MSNNIGTNDAVDKQLLVNEIAFEGHLLGSGPDITARAKTILDRAYRDYEKRLDKILPSSKDELPNIFFMACGIWILLGAFIIYVQLNSSIFCFLFVIVQTVLSFWVSIPLAHYQNLRAQLAEMPDRGVVRVSITEHLTALLDQPAQQASNDLILYHADEGGNDPKVSPWPVWTFVAKNYTPRMIATSYGQLSGEQGQRFAALSNDDKARAVALATLKRCLYPKV